MHIVGGRGDDGVRGDAFGVPAKAKKKPQAGDSFAGPTRFVDFGGNRHFKISFGLSKWATEAWRRATPIGNITVDVKVILPNAPLTGYGYSTAVKLDDVLARIERRLEALDLSAHAASLAAKRPDAIRNLRRAIKNDDRRGITTETLMALAPVLKTTAAWLLEGVGDPASGNLVRVAGRIGAGAEIWPELEQTSPESSYEIEVPFPVSADAIAFKVEGDGMWPRYDPGDVIICWRQGTNAEDLIGWEAAVRTADGKRYLKRIQRGAASGTFDLESHNAPPIRGVRIEWAAEIKGVVRSGQWHRK
jgi:Peptidase S24-like